MLDFSNLSLICRKTQNEEIPERTLREMGFPIDVPDVQSPSFDLVFFQLHDKLFESPYVKYGSVGHIYLTFLMQNRDAAVAFRQTQQTLEPFHVTSEELQHELNLYGIDSLTAEDTELLCEVFQYLIETLLPRQLGDLYVDFSLRSHPAYSVFFSLAAEKLGIEVCNDHNDSRCGQLLGSTTSGAARHILAGQSLQFIYENTCATKRHIHSAVSMLFHYSEEALKDAQLSLDLLQIEDALFSLSRSYRYERRYVLETLDSSFDFAVFKENRLILLVDYIGEDIMDDDRLLSFDVAMARTRKKQEKCHQAGLPLLQFDTWELSYEDYFISSIVRRVLKNPEYAQTHIKNRRQQLADEDEFWEDEWEKEEGKQKSIDDLPVMCTASTSDNKTKQETVLTKAEFVKMIEDAMECVVFTVAGSGYTIIVWNEKGISICEWNKAETEKIYPDAKSLVDGFEVKGVPLADLVKTIVITEYC